MSKRPASARLKPQQDLVLVRKVTKGPQLSIALPDGTEKRLADERAEAIVVDTGPGSWEGGVFVPMPESIRPGASVAFPGDHSFQLKGVAGMAEEGLWLVRAADIFLVIEPDGMPEISAAGNRAITA